MDDPSLVEEQIRYYRGRAAEYDATSTAPDDLFGPHLDRVRNAIREFHPRGRVLELAAGWPGWDGPPPSMPAARSTGAP